MMLKIDELYFSYNSVSILKKITFEVNYGDFLGIIGPNGSGKTTLLRNIDGILKPNKGSILIENVNQKQLTRKEIARLIGYVPQREANIFPTTVFETVLMGRKPHINWTETKEDRKIVAETLEHLNLGAFALRDINQLSGGERQKVYIARALVQQPKILLLDEPTANLDLRHQIEVLDMLLNTKNERGVTVIIAIHDLNLALKYCDKVIILNKGEVFAKGGKEVINKEIIQNVYGVKVRIIEHEGQKFIIPIKNLENTKISSTKSSTLKEDKKEI
ncbi:MAG: ATP-binding cassette domain-containing protein [Candidatus Lokiarchaeota archaeon]|nr:ATP-binding cassette domain-containing protein [Candidatus Lokiarchaeota archaeon]